MLNGSSSAMNRAYDAKVAMAQQRAQAAGALTPYGSLLGGMDVAVERDESPGGLLLEHAAQLRAASQSLRQTAEEYKAVAAKHEADAEGYEAAARRLQKLDDTLGD